MRSLCVRRWVFVAVLPFALLVCGCRNGDQQKERTVTEGRTEPGAEAERQPAGAGEKGDAVTAARALGTPTENPLVATASGLQYIDVKEGEGDAATAGQIAVVHYTGWLVNGTKFDSSVDRGQPFRFPLGAGRVIKGWDEGVAGMKVGGVRKLIVPPELGYGSRGAGGVIPPNATLIFEVELLGVE
jgi:FKBP-type peptidyl-prolyl cis-trans isomerase